MEELESLQYYFDKLSKEGTDAITRALSYGKMQGVDVLTTDHLVMGCLDDPMFGKLLQSVKGIPFGYYNLIKERIEGHYRDDRLRTPGLNDLGRSAISIASPLVVSAIRKSHSFWKESGRGAPYGPSSLIAGILRAGNGIGEDSLKPLTYRDYCQSFRDYYSKFPAVAG